MLDEERHELLESRVGQALCGEADHLIDLVGRRVLTVVIDESCLQPFGQVARAWLQG